jgi:hypothetical protein
MLVGAPPFAAKDNTGAECFDALVVNVVRLDYRMPDEVSIEARQLIDAMLQVGLSNSRCECLSYGGRRGGGGGAGLGEFGAARVPSAG